MRITIRKLFQKIKEWASLSYSLKTLRSIKDLEEQGEYIFITSSKKSKVKPVCYLGEAERDVIEAILPETYIAVINNAHILGSSNVVVAGNTLYYDMLSKNDDRIRVSDNGLFRVWNKPIHIGKHYVCCYSNVGDEIKEGIYLGGNFSGNYYHFVIEFVSKFYLLEQYDIPSTVPLILDSNVRNIPQFKEIISIFNNRHIIYVDRLQLCKVGKLYYPSFVNVIPPNFTRIDYIKSEDCVFDEDSIRFIRDKFMGAIDSKNVKTPKKIFISRKSSKWRQYNEDEIIVELKKRGYEVVYPETMTAREQFTLFNGAKSIVAASGAALTNIICCKPSTKLIVLVSTKVEATIFSSIAYMLNIDLKYFTGEITTYNNVQSDFVIDVNKLMSYVDE